MRNQFQKTNKGVNVIVELEGSENRHHYSGNKSFKNSRVLTDLEIIGLAEIHMTLEDRLKISKEVVSRLDGFAISNVSDGTINSGDIVEIEE